jgi:hypothetical protein
MPGVSVHEAKNNYPRKVQGKCWELVGAQDSQKRVWFCFGGGDVPVLNSE